MTSGPEGSRYAGDTLSRVGAEHIRVAVRSPEQKAVLVRTCPEIRSTMSGVTG